MVTLLLLHRFYCLAYNLHKIMLDACATDQRPVDIGMGHELGDVRRGDAPTIENAHSLCRFGAIHLTVELANLVNDPACAFGGCCLASADGPDGFVGNNHSLCLLCREL